MWRLLPYDPMALPFMIRTHRQVLQELQAEASARRLFGADVPPPPIPLRDGSGGHNLLQDALCAAQHARAACE
jgi:hypothetical protein